MTADPNLGITLGMDTTYDFAPVIKAVQLLAGVCDGASTEDGRGYNKMDSGFGHSLAMTPREKWTLKMASVARKMITKYQGQLAAYGLPLESIPVPVVPTEEQLKVAKVAAAEAAVAARKLSFRDGQFIIAWDYRDAKFSEIKDRVKAIPSRRWNNDAKNWSVPLSTVTVSVVADIARDYLFDTTDAAEEALNTYGAAVAANIQASRAEDAQFEVEGLGGQLRPFQKAGVQYAVRVKRVLIGDEMGLGKTVQALATIAAVQAYPALIVTPASVKLNWAREISKWIPGKTVEVLNGKPGEYNADITVVNYDNVHKHVEAIKARKLKAISFDEFHYCKNRKARRTIACKELAEGVEYRLGLSGTPILNRVAEFITPLSILGRLDDVGGFKRLFFHHAAAFNNGYGYEFGEPRDLEQLNATLRATCYVRREKSQVLTELPEKTHSTVWVQLSNRAAYDRAEKMAASSKGSGAEVLANIEALKQLAAEGKMEAIKEWVADFLDSGEKLVLFAHHRSIQQQLVEAFPGSARVFGEDDAATRQENVDRFQNDPNTRLIVCSLGAAREGITLTAASNVAFVELGWTPGGMSQAEDRIHRIGQKNACTVWSLLADNSIDVWISELLEGKAQVVKAAAVGDQVEEVAMVSELMKKLKAKHKKAKKEVA